MYFRRLAAVTFVVLLGAGCADVPTASESGPLTMLVTGPVSAGTQAKARLVNYSDATIEMGDISCYLRIDRQEATGWVRLPRESDVCPMPLITLTKGGSLPFNFRVPSLAGTFRLSASLGGDSVYSPPFSVK